MITSDINIENNIVNVLVGEFFHINIETGPIKTVYGKFKCESIGRDVIQSDRIEEGMAGCQSANKKHHSIVETTNQKYVLSSKKSHPLI